MKSVQKIGLNIDSVLKKMEVVFLKLSYKFL